MVGWVRNIRRTRPTERRVCLHESLWATWES